MAADVADPDLEAVDKAQLRERARRLRRDLDDRTRQRAHERIAEHLAPLVDATDGPVALFAPTRFEASPLLIVPERERAGRLFAWPRVIVGSPTPTLSFHVAPFSKLVPATFGLLEPPANTPVVEAAALALIVVPGLAFDLELYRLGQGGGYYDATLSGLAAPKVGLAYGCQRVERVPRAPHDVPVDLLVTEEGGSRAPG